MRGPAPPLASNPHPWHIAGMKLPLAAIGALALVSSASAAGSLSAEQSQWISRAERHGKAGWIYLHVEGGPEERGFQHGYLLAPEISECLRVLRAEWLHESSMDWNWLVANTRGFIEPKIDSEDAAELRGIAEGMQAAGRPATYDDIVTYNASIELTDYWWPLAKRKLDGDRRPGGDAAGKPAPPSSPPAG